MRHTITRVLARALGIRTCDRRYVRISTRYHIQKVPQLPKWPLLQLTTSTYIGSSAAYVVTMYTSGSGTRPLAKSWELLASGTTRTIATLWRHASNVLARVHPWVSFDKSWLSFRLSRTPWLYDRLWIL